MEFCRKNKKAQTMRFLVLLILGLLVVVIIWFGVIGWFPQGFNIIHGAVEVEKEVLFKQGKQAYFDQDYEKAMEKFQELIDRFPKYDEKDLARYYLIKDIHDWLGCDDKYCEEGPRSKECKAVNLMLSELKNIVSDIEDERETGIYDVKLTQEKKEELVYLSNLEECQCPSYEFKDFINGEPAIERRFSIPFDNLVMCYCKNIDSDDKLTYLNKKESKEYPGAVIDDKSAYYKIMSFGFIYEDIDYDYSITTKDKATCGEENYPDSGSNNIKVEKEKEYEVPYNAKGAVIKKGKTAAGEIIDSCDDDILMSVCSNQKALIKGEPTYEVYDSNPVKTIICYNPDDGSDEDVKEKFIGYYHDGSDKIVLDPIMEKKKEDNKIEINNLEKNQIYKYYLIEDSLTGSDEIRRYPLLMDQEATFDTYFHAGVNDRFGVINGGVDVKISQGKNGPECCTKPCIPSKSKNLMVGEPTIEINKDEFKLCFFTTQHISDLYPKIIFYYNHLDVNYGYPSEGLIQGVDPNTGRNFVYLTVPRVKVVNDDPDKFYYRINLFDSNPEIIDEYYPTNLEEYVPFTWSTDQEGEKLIMGKAGPRNCKELELI